MTQDPWEAVGSSSYSTLRFGEKESEYQKDTWGAEYPGSVKSYLMEQFTGLLSTKKNNNLTGNFFLKLAKKQLQKANNKRIDELTASLSRLESIGVSSTNRFQLATTQNSLLLMRMLNLNMGNAL